MENKNLFTELSINLKQQAEKSLSTLIDRAYEIDTLLQSDLFTPNEISKNQLNTIIPSVQNHLRDFIEIVEHLTLWLELEIPSYSECDDFRLVVQNEILDEIASMKANSIVYMGQFVDYREQRAIANKELFKRSKFDDNYQLISYLDDQLYRNLKLMLMEIKSYILRICNILTKNRDLINRQSSSHHQHVNNYL
jgi:hypothetical protein